MNLPALQLIQTGTLIGVLVGILGLAIRLAGIVAFIYILIGGYKYITSGDSPEGAQKGKNTLTYAIIGLIIVVISYAIIEYVIKEINKIH